MPLLVVGRHEGWPTLGPQVVEWIERHLCHGPGDVQGDPFVIDDEEWALICDLYRLYPPGHARAGRRVVSRALYSRSKGRRKSELAGALVCLEALGPSRFWKWGGDGPLTRRVSAPFIRCLATEEGQTGNTYDNVRVMLEHACERFPGKFAGVDIGLTRTFVPDGEIRPSTASSASKDGGKETFAVADEEHLYVLSEPKQMHRTVSRNLVKRKQAEPWLLGTTTMYRRGQGSTAEAAFDAAQAVLDGRAKHAGLYLNHRQGNDVADWSDDAAVLAALREAYGVASDWMDLERIVSEEIRSPDVEEADSRRYFNNQAWDPAEQAFDLERWDELATDAEIVPGALVTLGFDGAQFHDATGLVATEVATGHQQVLGVWECPPDAADGWQVDLELVDRCVADAFDRFEVWRMYADPPYWQGPLSDWQGRYGDKIVVEWWTHRNRPMVFALQAYATAQRAGDLTHDGDKAYRRHIGNARRSETRIRDEATGRLLWTIRKDHPKSPRKIDLAMAGCLSWEARRDALAAGAKTRRRKRGAASF